MQQILMDIKMLVHMGLLCVNEILKLLILKVLELSMFLKKFVGYKNMKTNILRIKGNNSTKCGYFSIRFIGFMLVGKALIDYKFLFSPYDFEKKMVI